jgi:hypothetical protein
MKDDEPKQQSKSGDSGNHNGNLQVSSSSMNNPEVNNSVSISALSKSSSMGGGGSMNNPSNLNNGGSLGSGNNNKDNGNLPKLE